MHLAHWHERRVHYGSADHFDAEKCLKYLGKIGAVTRDLAAKPTLQATALGHLLSVIATHPKWESSSRDVSTSPQIQLAAMQELVRTLERRPLLDVEFVFTVEFLANTLFGDRGQEVLRMTNPAPLETQRGAVLLLEKYWDRMHEYGAWILPRLSAALTPKYPREMDPEFGAKIEALRQRIRKAESTN